MALHQYRTSDDARAFVQRCQAAAGVWPEADYLTALVELLTCLKAVPHSKTFADRVAVSSALLRLAWYVGQRQASDLSVEMPCQTRRLRRRDRVTLALRLVASLGRHHDMTLGFVASRIGVTDPYLSRAIKAETGLQFATLLHGPRLIDAAVLLRTTNLSIEEIAHTVGYRRTNELDTHFVPWFHMTPRDFRSIVRSNAFDGPGDGPGHGPADWGGLAARGEPP